MCIEFNKKGFTLIELLVVIAIIGILASVVLGSLNEARDKGVDTAVKTSLKGIRDQAAIYYSDNRYSYSGFCVNDQNGINAIGSAMSAVSASATLGGLGDGECVASDTEWAVWVNLKSASTTAWCVDSVGKSDTITAQDSSAVDLTLCP